MSLRSGKLPSLGSEDKFLDHRGLRIGAGYYPPSGPIAAGQDWPRHPRCDHSPRWDSPSPSAPPTVPSPHQLWAVRRNDGIWIHRTCWRLACDTNPGWYPAWPRMLLPPASYALGGERSPPTWPSQLPKEAVGP